MIFGVKVFVYLLFPLVSQVQLFEQVNDATVVHGFLILITLLKSLIEFG